MPRFNPLLWRAARQLQAFLHPAPLPIAQSVMEPNSIGAIARTQEQLQDAQKRGWRVVEHYLRRRLHAQVLRLQAQSSELLECVPLRQTVLRIPSQCELYDELLALSNEFDGFEVDLRERKVSVISEPIVLEEIELGPFRITLHWNDTFRHAARPFRVTALEPNPPSSRSDITHPHVLNEHLCEGDAATPLSLALQTGRLTDVFLIINRVLHSYNESSPYAALSDWRGVDCHACGRYVRGDASYCTQCEASVCDDCGTSCGHCDRASCDACIQMCAGCEQSMCGVCSTPCIDCGSRLCPDCLTTSQHCQECADDWESKSNANQSTEPSTPETDFTVHAVGMGEALVSA